MRGLFAKFFFVTWLTMVATISALIAISFLSDSVPYKEVVIRDRQVFALDIAEALLKQEGLPAALAFSQRAESAAESVKLLFSNVGPSSACIPPKGDIARYVIVGDSCERVTVESQDGGIIKEALMKAGPWLAALIASALSAFWIARYLTRPVTQLRQGLSALARGDFEVRIGGQLKGWKDEVTDLAQDFDSTAGRLQELQEVQNQLFHDVSHELRSPLSRLQAALGVLRQSPQKLDALLGRMNREIERMDGLIGEILTLARLAARSGEQPLQILNLQDLLGEIVDDATFEAQSKGITVTHEGAEPFVREVNGELIYRALENVIRNAIKFSPANSRILIRSRVVNDRLFVDVVDEGVGVPESELERIFRPFARGGAAPSQEGFGLGLAIARHALERHGGCITASLAETGGLMMTLEIPAKQTRSNVTRF